MAYTTQGKTVGLIGYGLLGRQYHSHHPHLSPTNASPGLTWRPTPLSQETAISCLRTALESGCTYWNGGEIYGTPTSNSLTLLKSYFTQHPEDASKILLNIKSCSGEHFKPDCSPSGVRKSVETCLRQLGNVGGIDQFEAARKDPEVEIEIAVKAMEELVKEGKIGGIALSEVSAETIRRAAKVAKIEAVEVELSLWCTEPLENGVLKACKELDIPVIAYSPLGRGALTGKITSPDDIPEGDFRRMLPRFQPDVFEKNLRLVKEIERLAERKGCTPGQVAINWVVELGKRVDMPVIIPIPGASRPERVRENAVLVELTDSEMKEIDGWVKELAPLGDRYHESGMKLLDR